MTTIKLRLDHGNVENDEQNRVLEVVGLEIHNLLEDGVVQTVRSRGTNDYTEWSFECQLKNPLDLAKQWQEMVATLAPEGWTISYEISGGGHGLRTT